MANNSTIINRKVFLKKKFNSGFLNKKEGYPLSLEKSFKKDLLNYEVYGNSLQEGIPTPDNPVEVQSLGELVTETTDVNYGKYKIPIKVTNGVNESITNIYLDEPLRKIKNCVDYIDFKSRKVIRKIKAFEFNGDNRLWYLSGNYFRYNTKNSENITLISSSSVYSPLSTHYKVNNNFTNGNIVVDKNGLYISKNITESFNNNSDEYNNWCKTQKNIGKPFIIYAALETPIEETIDLPLIKLWQETNTITTECEIQASNIKAEYRSNKLNNT